MATGLNTQELSILLQSLQTTLEEGRLKASLLHKQGRYQAAQEVLASLQPVQALLDRVAQLQQEVLNLSQPTITIPINNY